MKPGTCPGGCQSQRFHSKKRFVEALGDFQGALQAEIEPRPAVGCDPVQHEPAMLIAGRATQTSDPYTRDRRQFSPPSNRFRLYRYRAYNFLDMNPGSEFEDAYRETSDYFGKEPDRLLVEHAGHDGSRRSPDG